MTRPAGRRSRNCVSGPVRVFGQSEYKRRWPRSLSAICTTCGNPPLQKATASHRKTRPSRSTIGERRSAPAPRAAGLYPHRYWSIRAIWTVKRRLPHQRRRRGHPVRGGLYGRENQRALPPSRLGTAARHLPLPGALGFHSDNGSEYINRDRGRVAGETADRVHQVAFAAVQRQTSAESKNGAVFENCSVVVTSRSASHRSSTTSTSSISTPTSLSTAPCFFPRDPHGQPRQTTQGLSLRDYDDAL